MTAKEKAEQLVNSFYYALPNNGSPEGINSTTKRMEEAVRCALIAVDEILKLSNNLYNSIKTKFYLEVKKEIQNL